VVPAAIGKLKLDHLTVPVVALDQVGAAEANKVEPSYSSTAVMAVDVVKLLPIVISVLLPLLKVTFISLTSTLNFKTSARVVPEEETITLEDLGLSVAKLTVILAPRVVERVRFWETTSPPALE